MLLPDPCWISAVKFERLLTWPPKPEPRAEIGNVLWHVKLVTIHQGIELYRLSHTGDPSVLHNASFLWRQIEKTANPPTGIHITMVARITHAEHNATLMNKVQFRTTTGIIWSIPLYRIRASSTSA